jgi:DNA-binding beta-propeller fold protein YncE
MKAPPGLFGLSLIALASLGLGLHAQEQIPPASANLPVTSKVSVGAAPHLYETVPGWGAVPSPAHFGPTHGGVAVDKSGQVYVSTNSTRSIYVFRSDGVFLRSMAPQFAGSSSIAIREENGVEYLYGVHLRQTRAFKMALNGSTTLVLPTPVLPEVYGSRGEGYTPAGIAVAPDGSIFVSDSYGSCLIHKYSGAGVWLKSFGGKGGANGKFNVCQGMAVDARAGQPRLLVCDRDNRRLQRFDLEGNFVDILGPELGRPTALAISGQFLAVAELEGRVTLLDGSNAAVAHLGDNPNQDQWGNPTVPPAAWRAGMFTAPHGIAWGKDGSLYVQDWSTTGRLTKLTPRP